jgi:hypothetical protein
MSDISVNNNGFINNLYGNTITYTDASLSDISVNNNGFINNLYGNTITYVDASMSDISVNNNGFINNLYGNTITYTDASLSDISVNNNGFINNLYGNTITYTDASLSDISVNNNGFINNLYGNTIEYTDASMSDISVNNNGFVNNLYGNTIEYIDASFNDVSCHILQVSNILTLQDRSVQTSNSGVITGINATITIPSSIIFSNNVLSLYDDGTDDISTVVVPTPTGDIYPTEIKLYIPSIEDPFFIKLDDDTAVSFFKVSGFVTTGQAGYVNLNLLQTGSGNFKWVGTGYSPV